MGFRRVVEKLRRAQRPIIWVVQKTILHVSLFLLYYVGFGLFRLFMTVFARRTLFNRPPGRQSEDSYWRAAKGYELEESRLTRQS